MTRPLSIALSMALFCLATSAFANTIDQNQPSGPVYMAAFSQADLAQSFMQSHGNISGAGIFLKPDAGSIGNVTIALWDGLPDEGGSMLAAASGPGTQGQWVDVFWSPVATSSMTTYYLVFSGENWLGIMGDSENPYPNGHVYANAGFMPFEQCDYTFRTFYDETPAGFDTWTRIKAAF